MKKPHTDTAHRTVRTPVCSGVQLGGCVWYGVTSCTFEQSVSFVCTGSGGVHLSVVCTTFVVALRRDLLYCSAMDRELVRHLEVLLAKARAGQLLFYVGSAAVLVKGSAPDTVAAEVVAGSFVPPVTAQLDPASRKGAYEKMLEGLAGATVQLTGKPLIVPGEA